MFICFECQENLASNPELLEHIRKAHPFLKVYRCTEIECRRCYSTYYSFWRHRNREHNSSTTLESFSECVSNSTYNLDNEPHNKSYDIDNNNKASISNVETNNYDIDNNNKGSTSNVKTDVVDKTLAIDESDYEDEIIESFEMPDLQNVNINFEDFETSLKNTTSRMIAKWYSLNDLPRKRVQMILNDITVFLLEEVMTFLQNKVLSRLEYFHDNPQNICEVRKMFDLLRNPFDSLNTEWNQFKYFIERGTLILPVQHIIEYSDKYCDEKGKTIIKKIPITVQYIPMYRVFTQFFSMPNVYSRVTKYVDSLYNNSKILSNIIQADLWQEKRAMFGGKFVLPLLMYFDEYETNNPLGSHKGIKKCGALYLKIPSLPPIYQAKLSNVFLFGLFNAADRDNPKTFHPAIDQLNDLEKNGNTIFINNQPHKIFFKLINIIGDNLALHQMFGLVTNFNATFFCRFCLIKREDINSVFDDNQCALRTKKNYENQLKLNNTALTGIVKPSILQDLSDYHFTQNLVVDVMHDILEGVSQYDLGKILHFYIKKKLYFSVDEFNLLVKGFHFNHNDKQNKPCDLTENHIKNQRFTMTACEMLNLIRNLPMIIGHLIPEECKYWNLIIFLQKITFCVTEKYCPFEHYYLLDSYISDYLSILQELFPNSFKPKHHFLTHYGRVMKLVGPLWHIACIGFERKHRSSKVTAHVSINRQNICYTLALKEQLVLNNRFLKAHDEEYEYEFISGTTKEVSLHELNNYKYFSTLLLSISLENKVFVTDWICYDGLTLKPEMVVMIPSEEGPNFYFIYYLILCKTHKIVALTEKLIAYYNYHFQAYEIVKNDRTFIPIYWIDLRYSIITYRTKLGDGKDYIAKRWV